MIIRPLLPIVILLAAALAGPSHAKDADVIVKVNGRQIKRSEVQERLWSLHADAVINQLVDDTVVQQAIAAFEANAGKKDKEGWKKETDARLKNVRNQFKDEAAFQDQLQKAGATMEGLRAQLDAQVLREQMVIAAKKLQVTPDEVKDFYEANKDKLGSSEAVRLRHILLADEKQAKDLLVAVRVGADFERLARELSLDAASRDRGGDLGFISRGMLTPDIEKGAFGLQPGEVAPVVKTQAGYHLLKVEERREAKPAVYKDIEKDLTQALLAQKISQAWPPYVQELRGAAKIEPSQAAAPRPAAAPVPGRPAASASSR